jgi:hypothetical protein
MNSLAHENFFSTNGMILSEQHFYLGITAMLDSKPEFFNISDVQVFPVLWFFGVMFK